MLNRLYGTPPTFLYQLKCLLKTSRLLFTLVLITPAYAESPLWKVSKGNDHLYIGGTVHVLGYRDYPLPKEFDEVYKQSEMLVFETDINEMQSPKNQALMASKMIYQDGSKLEQHLKSSTYKALEQYLKPLGIPVITFEDYRPGMVSIMLTMMELRRLGIMGAGVDQFYNNKAVNDKKNIGKLETIEEQISFLEKMGEGDPDEFILYTLREMKNMEEMFKSLKQAWRIGDNRKLAELALDPLKEFPETYQMLVVKRNKAWVPQIEAMLKTKEIEMVLVGALHLVGEESVLKQLEALGYKIKNL